jgi:hypothetical protein
MIGALSIFPLEITFNSILRSIISYKLLEEEKDDQPWYLGRGRTVEWKSCNSFEGMEVSSDGIRRLEP